MRITKNASGTVTSGTGTANTVAKYTSATAIGNSSITDDGTTVATTEAVNFGASAAWVINSSGKPTKSNGISLAGQGFPLIVASSIQSLSNAAFTTVSYTPPSTAGTYRWSVYLQIVTATTITFLAKMTYQTPAGTSIAGDGADKLFLRDNNSNLGVPANTADRFFLTFTLGIDNSGTAITFADNGGTYTTCAYRLNIILEQLA